MSYKKIFILGHVGQAPEIRRLPNGGLVANFSLATNERYMVNGVAKETTEWWRVDAFQKGDSGLVTGVIKEYVKSGTQLMIEGSPQQDEWIDKSTGAKRNGFKIRIGHPGTSLQLCGRPGGNGKASSEAGKTEEAMPTDQATGAPLTEDDIPF